MSPYHCRIPPHHPPRGDSGAENAMGALCLGDHEEAGRFLVQTMDDSRAVGVAGRKAAISAAEQSIDERSGPVSRRGVNYHAGSLVDDEESVVLVHDPDRDILGDHVPLFDLGNDDADSLAALKSVARLLLSAVHADVAERDQRRRLCARNISLPGDKQIEANIAVRLDQELGDAAQTLALGGSFRHGRGTDQCRLPLLSPEHPGKQEGAGADCHVGHVEGWPAHVTHSDIDEIDDSER